MTNKIDSGPGNVVRPTNINKPGPITQAIPLSSGDNKAELSATSATDAVRFTGEAQALRLVQRQAKAGPAPMDAAKINALRAALAAGEYRINPAEIAKRLDALERELGF